MVELSATLVPRSSPWLEMARSSTCPRNLSVSSSRTLMWVAPDGTEGKNPAPRRIYIRAKISPDQTMIAVEARGSENDIWIWMLSSPMQAPNS